MKKQADFPRLTLRLPNKLLDKIKGVANKNERSINAEVIARLNESFITAGNTKTPAMVVNGFELNTDALAAKIAEKMKRIKEQQERNK